MQIISNQESKNKIELNTRQQKPRIWKISVKAIQVHHIVQKTDKDINYL